MAVSPLSKFKILIADSDRNLASISKTMLLGMGFRDIHLTASGIDALRLTKTGTFDFLITDWNLRELDGLTLIKHIRRDRDSPNPTLPIIMLTARMELADVTTARDIGTHEYVVKPFSAQAIYNRLERIVEFPRYFIIGKEFVGPDRRNRSATVNRPERRKKKILPKRKPFETATAIHTSDEPQIWLPDTSLKHKIGQNMRLESLITPAMLAQAQSTIDESSEASLDWIKEDLNELIALCGKLTASPAATDLILEIGEVLLSISARAGTFGYKRGSEVAYALYLFLRNTFKPALDGHHKVIAKHIEVLQLIFDSNIRTDTGDLMLVMAGLKNLVSKYSA